MTEIELSTGTIEYADTGGEGPTLVLLHGLLMDASLWDDVVSDLSVDHRCVVPTLPLGAHRHAMHADADLSLRGIARLVTELLDRLDLRGVTVVGTDTGGALVQLLACDGNARVSRIVSRLATRSTISSGSDREDAGADREAPTRDVRSLHAADAPAASPAAPDRVRVADQARGRRHSPMDETGVAAARDPPRHRPSPACSCSRPAALG